MNSIKELTLESKKALLKERLQSKNSKDKAYELASPGQQALWAFTLANPGSHAYHLKFTARVITPISGEIIEMALNDILKRHRVLCSRFIFKDEKLFEVFDQNNPITLEMASVTEIDLGKRILDDYAKPFDLKNGPLLRAYLYTLSETEQVLLLVVHHIVIDGLSLLHLIGELGEIIGSRIHHTQPKLSALKLDYLHYLQYQANLPDQTHYQAAAAYWRDNLSNVNYRLNLPYDHLRKTSPSFAGDSCLFTIDKEKVVLLKKLASQHQLTLNAVLLSIYQLTLLAVSGQKAVLCATPSLGRGKQEFLPLLGYFANMMVIRTDVHDGISLIDLLEQVKQTLFKAVKYQEYPFVRLVQELEVERSLTNLPLVQAAFAFHQPLAGSKGLGISLNLSENESLQWGDSQVKPFRIGQTACQFDLYLIALEMSNSSINLSFEFMSDVFHHDTIKVIAKHYLSILDVFISDIHYPVQSLPDYQPFKDHENYVLNIYNNTGRKFNFYSLPEMLMDSLSNHSKNIAVVDQDVSYTYEHLFKLGFSIGENIRSRQRLNGQAIGILLEKGVMQVASILGVLFSGNYFIPMHTETPSTRLQKIIHNANIDILITSLELSEQHSFINVNMIDAATIVPKDNISVDSVDLSAIAYVIYTSGTTGVPKGVVISQESLLNTVLAINEKFNISATDKTFAISDLSFDLAMYDVFGMLLAGGSLIYCRQADVKEPKTWLTLIEKHQVTLWNSVPMLFAMLLKQCTSILPFKNIFLSGDWINVELVTQGFAKCPYANIISLGGPTETTIWSIHYPLARDNDYEFIPYGFPLPNHRYYILHENLTLCHENQLGEIYAAGMGLAQSYLHDDELTQKTFIMHAKLGRIYRTGDIGLMTKDFGIRIKGRSDRQVKIGGHRIELEDVRLALEQCFNEYTVTCAVAGESSHKRLIAYIESKLPIFSDYQWIDKIDQDPKLSSCYHRLTQLLPAYMIPSLFVYVAAMPLSRNGKIAYDALPNVLLSLNENTSLRIETQLENTIAHVWSRILNVPMERLFKNSDFFQLGGDSLSAVSVMDALEKKLQQNCRLQHLFENTTIEKLARSFEQVSLEREEALPVLVPNQIDQYQPFPLTPVQQAYWVGRQQGMDLGKVGTHSYIEFDVDQLDLERFQLAINKVVARHDMLRVIFLHNGTQQVLERVPSYPMSIIDLRAYSYEDQDNAIAEIRARLSHEVLSMQSFPVFNISVYQLTPMTRIILSYDALQFDAWSLRIFLREIYTFYQDINSGVSSLTFYYRDYVEYLAKIKDNSLYIKAKSYWQNRIPHLPFGPELPIKSVPEKQAFNRLSGHLNIKSWVTIKEQAKQFKCTPTCLVLAVFAWVMRCYSKNSHFCLNLTLFNRLKVHPEIDNIIGDFTSLNLLEVNIKDAKIPFSSFLQSLQQQLFLDLDNRFYDGVEVQRDLARFHQTNGVPVAPVVFTSTLGFVRSHDDKNVSQVKINYSITQTPQVWLDNQISENESGLYWNWDYIDGLFDSAVINTMHMHYEYVLVQLINENWNNYVLPDVMPEYLNQIDQFNNTEYSFEDCSLSSACLRSIRKHFTNTAIIDENNEMSYEDLLYSALGLAKKIKSYNLKKGSAIGVLLEKGAEQVIACLGILFSGHYFVPLNIANPAKRLKILIHEANIDLIVTDEYFKNHFSLDDDMFLNINKIDNSVDEPIAELDTNQTAYVIYTSGSTGIPKGVVISHRSVLNTIDDINERLSVSSTDKVLAISDLSFDLAIYDIFGLLLAGGTVVFPRQAELKEPAHWIELIEKYQITLWNSVPMLFSMLVYSEIAFPSLRTVMLSGDWIMPEVIAKGFQRCPKATFVALGGATECSIWSNYYLLHRDQEYSYIPYGFPLKNQKFYILHDDLSLCPEGVEGSLYIGGLGLGKEYYNDVKKTQAAFIHHPKFGRLYHTGDLALMTNQYGIKFLGRKDTQVKIGGYRIELNEVEHALKRTLPIDQLILDVQGENDKQLIAYCVMTDKEIKKKEQQLSKINIRKWNDNTQNYQITFSTENQDLWFHRKSYRKWLNKPVDYALIQSLLTGSSNKIELCDSRQLQLYEALNSLSAIEEQSCPLPKYRYPSAGGLYPVQCYLSFACGLPDIPAGCYYYSPINKELVKLSDEAMHDVDEIYFIAASDLISPFYKSSWQFFCEVEAGHMAALISQNINISMNHSIINNEKLQLSDHHVVMNQFQLWQTDNVIVPEIKYTLHNLRNNIVNFPEDHTVNSKNFDVWGETAAILQHASGLLLFDRSNSGFAIGWYAQRWMESAASVDLGCCYLGNLHDRNNRDSQPYLGMAFGMVDQAMLNSHDISSISISKQVLLQEVYSRLQSELPAYMLPGQFIFLDNIPLSQNGKIDKSALPKANRNHLSSQEEPIVSSFEKLIATIWSEVLNLPSNLIYRQSDFFALGGHSLKALEMLSLIKTRLDIVADLKSIFSHSRLAKFAEQLRLKKIGHLYDASRFITLNEAEEDSPIIILLHPSTGTIDCYLGFSVEFSKDFKLVAIQYKNSSAENLHELASEYANDIMKKFPHKKIHLLGYSLGAHIAFEIAKIFEENGFDYMSLACVDSEPVIETGSLIYETDDDMNVFEHVLKNDYGVTPEKLPLFMRYMTERQNAMVSICEEYLTQGKLKCPIGYFKANQILTTLKKRIEQAYAPHWKDFTSHETVITYDINGNHMNILSERHVHSFLHYYDCFLKNISTISSLSI